MDNTPREHLLPPMKTSFLKEVKWRPWKLQSRNPMNRSKEPIAPKAERTSKVETITPQPERTQP